MTAHGSNKKATVEDVDRGESVKIVADALSEEESSVVSSGSTIDLPISNPILSLDPPGGEQSAEVVSQAGADKKAGQSVECSGFATSGPGSALVGSVNITGTTVEKFPLLESIEAYLAPYRPCAEWVWSLRAPLCLLAAIGVFPKFIFLWIFIIIAKPISLWLYERFPIDWKARIYMALPQNIRHAPWMRDMSEGADQGLPFILFWLYLCCAPFAIAWIALHWIRGFLPSPAPTVADEEGFVFTQNKRLDSVRTESTFYYSRAFGIVMFVFFALGIPAVFSYAVYERMGIEKMIQTGPVLPAVTPIRPTPLPTIPRVGLVTRPRFDQRRVAINAPTGADATFVTGYGGYWPWLRSLGHEPTRHSVFFVHFYLMSLATALCILFFRAWFLFPLNFLSDEHDVEFTESGIKRKTLKSWFLSVITFNRWAIGGGPDSLKWNEVKGLRRMEEGFFRLCPLPDTAFKKESLSYKLLNKIAALIDGISYRSNPGNFLIFSCVEKEGDFGRNIKINLNDLNREQRARLFYAVKKWAPHVIINEKAEEQLLGSIVLRDNRYTQLWFDVLTYRTRVRRENILPAGETLKGGDYKIDDRISSGGQATTYLATKASGEKCVLKEFILATSSTSSAPIESAREFEAEVSLLSQLSHPGIVSLEDFFFEDGRVYVAMEYIEGVTLRQKVQQDGKLSESEVVRITQATCDVLEYLHGCTPPIVHRDVTPENILLGSDGTIKLIDFSLAVRQDGRQTTDSCAKQCFTPPEQFREEVCIQSDIYALGATMYFLLTGLTPKPISRSSPGAKVPEITSALNTIVERATELELSQRYESVYWLKLDLARFCSDEDSTDSECQSSDTAKSTAAS